MKFNIKYFELAMVFWFFAVCVQINAQTIIATNKPTPQKTYSIEWIGKYPTGKSHSKNWLTNFLFGSKNLPEITKPNAIIATDSTSFLVLDQGSGTIFYVKNNEKKIPKILKKNKKTFPSLISFCKLPDNDILFTDSRLNKIYRMNDKLKTLGVFNDSLSLHQPTGIAYSVNTKEIWVVETAAHRISIINEQGKLIKTIGKKGTQPGEFNYPTNIWIANNGNVYVVDALNFRIQVFDKKGSVISVFGEIGDATGYFARPKGIATDSYGNIYICDALFNTVQVFDIAGNFLYQFGEQGRGNGQFWMPTGIYIDSHDIIYVADSYNARIQLFKRKEEKY